MNVHHLELFYYVARHGGIMPAVRNIPYGIQQPAVSSQIAQLEEFLGVTLFQRRPFQLTAEGEKLFAFVQPFFAGLDKMAAELQGGETRSVRLGASNIILREHLPELLQRLRTRHPGLRVHLREGNAAHLEQLLLRDEIELAITTVEKKPAAGLHILTLIELPLVLLVEKNSAVQSPGDLWGRDKIDETLICLPPGESLCKNFQQKLAELGVDWFPGIEASSADLIETYVSRGLGIGVSVAMPNKTFAANIRVLPLPDFPAITVGALWRGRKTPIVEAIMAEIQQRARRFQ